MTPIKDFLLYGSKLYQRDWDDNLTFVAVFSDPDTARWASECLTSFHHKQLRVLLNEPKLQPIFITEEQ